jgi:cell division protein ZapA (FtsZ GTPase activity inhibitor)
VSKRAVTVRIANHDYRIRSDADEDWLQRVASSVDALMGQIREKTGTIDSLDVSVLTSLNLARELLEARGESRSRANAADPIRLRALIELAESAVGDSGDRGQAADSLLTVPAGDEVDAVEADLLGPLLDPIEAADGAEMGAGRATGAGAARI